MRFSKQQVADAHLPLTLVFAGGLVHRERARVFKLEKVESFGSPHRRIIATAPC